MDLQKIIDKIKDGYTVIEYEEDGHDECGSLYWVWCKNGWSGRSWELDSKIKQDIKNAKNKYYKTINKIPKNNKNDIKNNNHIKNDIKKCNNT